MCLSSKELILIGDIVSYEICDRMWCRPDKTCCYKLKKLYQCPKCKITIIKRRN